MLAHARTPFILLPTLPAAFTRSRRVRTCCWRRLATRPACPLLPHSRAISATSVCRFQSALLTGSRKIGFQHAPPAPPRVRRTVTSARNSATC